MVVEREKGESGDDAYRINAKLVHAILVALFGSLMGLIGYMSVWAMNDARWKATLDEKLLNASMRLRELEVLTRDGILPIAKERIDQIERRLREHDTRNHNQK